MEKKIRIMNEVFINCGHPNIIIIKKILEVIKLT